MAKTGASLSDTKAEVALRAYAIWESEGRPHGYDLDHWLRAETELGSKPAAQKIQRRKTQRTSKPRKKAN